MSHKRGGDNQRSANKELFEWPLITKLKVLGKGVCFLLVVEDNVWPPDVVGWDVKHVNPSVLVGVPSHFVVVPKLFDPQVGRHYLIA